jgi:aminoglycoside phosphotransferase (APT) family kinase protein
MQAPLSTDPAGSIPGLDHAALARYLSSVLDDYDVGRDLTLRLLEGGRSNLTCLVTQPGGSRWVLRRPPLGHITPTAHDMSREYQTLTLLGAAGDFPSPRARALCMDPAVLGVTFIIYDFVPGLIIADPETAAGLTPQQASVLCGEMVANMARLHAITPPALAPGRSASSGDYLRRQLARWTDQWRRNQTRQLPAFDELGRWLTAAVGALTVDYPVTIVHGDYRLDNLVLDPVGLEVRAVLDWEMSTLGDPLSDLAILLAYWEEPGDNLRMRVSVARQLTTSPGFWTRQQLLDQYLEATGLSADHLDVCLALACLKLATITEGIHYRHLAGDALDDLSADMADAAPALVETGLLVADGQGLAALAG